MHQNGIYSNEAQVLYMTHATAFTLFIAAIELKLEMFRLFAWIRFVCSSNKNEIFDKQPNNSRYRPVRIFAPFTC